MAEVSKCLSVFSAFSFFEFEKKLYFRLKHLFILFAMSSLTKKYFLQFFPNVSESWIENVLNWAADFNLKDNFLVYHYQIETFVKFK